MQLLPLGRGSTSRMWCDMNPVCEVSYLFLSVYTNMIIDTFGIGYDGFSETVTQQHHALRLTCISVRIACVGVAYCKTSCTYPFHKTTMKRSAYSQSYSLLASHSVDGTMVSTKLGEQARASRMRTTQSYTMALCLSGLES